MADRTSDHAEQKGPGNIPEPFCSDRLGSLIAFVGQPAVKLISTANESPVYENLWHGLCGTYCTQCAIREVFIQLQHFKFNAGITQDAFRPCTMWATRT